MKHYITKYSLTGGRIEIHETKPLANTSDYVMSFHLSGVLRVGVDACETESEALKAVEINRQKKIASLKKQIEKLEKLTFKIVEE